MEKKGVRKFRTSYGFRCWGCGKSALPEVAWIWGGDLFCSKVCGTKEKQIRESAEDSQGYNSDAQRGIVQVY